MSIIEWFSLRCFRRLGKWSNALLPKSWAKRNNLFSNEMTSSNIKKIVSFTLQFTIMIIFIRPWNKIFGSTNRPLVQKVAPFLKENSLISNNKEAKHLKTYPLESQRTLLFMRRSAYSLSISAKNSLNWRW